MAETTKERGAFALWLDAKILTLEDLTQPYDQRQSPRVVFREALGEVLGRPISRETINNYRYGTCLPPQGVLAAILRVFDLDELPPELQSLAADPTRISKLLPALQDGPLVQENGEWRDGTGHVFHERTIYRAEQEGTVAVVTENGVSRAMLTRKGHKALNAQPRRLARKRRPDRPWTPEEEALLGTRPDPELGEQIGRDRRKVAARRAELGVAAYTPRKGAPRERVSLRKPWDVANDPLLGSERDDLLAKKLGVSTGQVRNRRLKLQREGKLV